MLFVRMTFTVLFLNRCYQFMALGPISRVFSQKNDNFFCSSSQGMLAYTSVRKEEIPCCGVS